MYIFYHNTSVFFLNKYFSSYVFFMLEDSRDILNNQIRFKKTVFYVVLFKNLNSMTR